MIAEFWIVKLHSILSLSPKRGLNIFPLTRQKAYVPSRISPFPLVMSTRICWRKFSDFVSLKVAFNFAIARRTHRILWQSFQLICALHFSLCHRHKYPATTHIAKSSPFFAQWLALTFESGWMDGENGMWMVWGMWQCYVCIYRDSFVSVFAAYFGAPIALRWLPFCSHCIVLFVPLSLGSVSSAEMPFTLLHFHLYFHFRFP